MEIIVLIIAAIMVPSIVVSAVKVGEVFFKGVSWVLGAALFFGCALFLLGSILSH